VKRGWDLLWHHRGGRVEAEVWQEAKQVMERGKGRVLHFQLTAEQFSRRRAHLWGEYRYIFGAPGPRIVGYLSGSLKINRKGLRILATLISWIILL